MNLDPVFTSYAEYAYRKWYPGRYPDPLGEFADDIDDSTIRALQENSSSTRSAALILQLLELLLPRKHSELSLAAQRALLPRIEDIATPLQSFYFLRAGSDENRRKLWGGLKKWAVNSETPLLEWAHARLSLETQHQTARNSALATFNIDPSGQSTRLESYLRSTRDLFDFQLRKHWQKDTLPDWLSAFRLRETDSLVDWNDFESLAHHAGDVFQIPALPSLKRVQDEPALQQVLPVDPPGSVHQHYGIAAGPVDTLRFVQELGRSFFYRGINAQLEPWERLLGDPQIPHFWAFLYGATLTDRAGISRLVRAGIPEVAQRLAIIQQFWIRYDCALALYNAKLSMDLKEAQDLYVACWDAAFAIEPPHFLYVLDLHRSWEAMIRVQAYRGASAVVERLKSLYGREWFASRRCSSRLADYRYQGFNLHMNHLLADLDVVPG